MSSNNIKLPLYKVIIMGINIMVGVGLWIGPGRISEAAGGLGFLSWVMSGAILFPVIWSVAKLASIVPVQGGLYAYCSKGFGNTVGYFCGWLYYLCYTLAVATVISALRTDFLMMQFPKVALFAQPNLFLLVALVMIAGVNLLDLNKLANLQSILTGVKLFPVAAAVLVAPFFFKGIPSLSNPVEWQGLPLSLSFSIFSFLGFEFACSLAHVIKGGATQARKAVMLSFSAVIFIYVLFHFSLIQIMGAENLANLKAPMFPQFIQAAGGAFSTIGSWLAVLIPTITMLTYFNSLNAIMLLASTIGQALSMDNKVVGSATWNRLNQFGRPHFLLLITSAIILTMGFIVPDTKLLVQSVGFGLSGVLLMTVLALFKVDTDRSWFNLSLILWAVAVEIGLMSYFAFNAGTGVLDRIIVLSPVWGGMIFGWLIHTQGRPAQHFTRWFATTPVHGHSRSHRTASEVKPKPAKQSKAKKVAKPKPKSQDLKPGPKTKKTKKS